ncbi:hypothetical protein [Sphingomonas faeni]|uniref:hypothetical protein n=1 Tax=Sphingomonas faeni TaxID=185950 RepID=UPI0020BD890A|nr:hypothetical protein [Sphingomonas faeni]MCK8456452.1 hypothetical protein [Sphingomonas faeni]
MQLAELAWPAGFLDCRAGVFSLVDLRLDLGPTVVAALRRVAVKLRQIQEQSTSLAFVVIGMYGSAID